MLYIHAVFCRDFSELLGMGVVSDATDVGTGLWHLQHPLGHADGSLRRPSGDVLHIVLVLEFLYADPRCVRL